MSPRRRVTRRLSLENRDRGTKRPKIREDSNCVNGKKGRFVKKLSLYSDQRSSIRNPYEAEDDDSGFSGSAHLRNSGFEGVNTDASSGKTIECNKCMIRRSVAPYVECDLCRKSVDSNEKYLVSGGWIVCSFCYDNHSKGPFTFNTGSRNTTILKKNFKKQYNFLTVSEPVVECSLCCRSFHRMCVNYPMAASSSFIESDYICDDCEQTRHKLPTSIALPVSLSAKNISHTALSMYMEQRIHASFPTMPKVLVRVASSIPKKYTVEENLGKYFRKRKLEFPYMAKTICCFQLNEHKKYHMIFVLYVQEYDKDCPLPNRNTIYISVLDSVRLLEPQMNRTPVFQLVLLTYFDYMRMCGFKHVFLWSCPPIGPGMDYVFYRKPRNQRIITAAILNNWYQQLFAIARTMNTIAKFSTLNDWVAEEIFSMEDFLKKFPFFHGDHWPDEVAKLIDTMGKTQNPDDLLFKKIQSKLARNRNSFHVLTLNVSKVQHFRKNFRSSDVVVPSVLADDRDKLASFLRNNYLEFEDVRKATYATQAVVLQIALEQMDSTLESMGFKCFKCIKGIREGYACMECEYRGCTECWNRKGHHHRRLRKIVLPIKIPNLFKEEYKWNTFKNDILGSPMQNVLISTGIGNLIVANKEAIKRIIHCSWCTLDLCSKCLQLRNEMWDLLKIPGGC